MTTARLDHTSAQPVPTTTATANPELTALRIAVSSLDEQCAWRPTRCLGWVVRDLLLHLLGDAQRGLVALATPASGPADRNAVTYWQDTTTGADPESRELRNVRAVASAWGLGNLTRTFVDTTRAVVTLAVEAAVHHLDLVVDLARPGPRPEPLAMVRHTLDGLLGRPAPAEWPDERWALLGTGRVPPGGGERRVLGAATGRLPLFG